jgi:hypothetical protein
MADFPARGTVCGECNKRPASFFSGCVPVCWECDGAEDVKTRVARMDHGGNKPQPPAKTKRAYFPVIPPKPNKAQSPAAATATTAVPPGDRYVSLTFLNSQGDPVAVGEPQAAETDLANEIKRNRAVVETWSEELHGHPGAVPKSYYAAVIADLEEKRADLVADLEAIDACLPILRVIEARKTATANQPERLNA